MWELTLLLLSTPSGLYYKDRVQSSLLSLELRSVPPGPDPLSRLSEPPIQVSPGLAGCSLLAPRCILGAAWDSCCQLAPIDFYAKDGQVFP